MIIFTGRSYAVKRRYSIYDWQHKYFVVSIDYRTENLSDQVQLQEYVQAVAPKRLARIAKIQSDPPQDYGRPKRATKPSVLTKTPYTQEKNTKKKILKL